ncbi:hypothetical protein [Haloarcula nitratireducens]|uniref:Uncharacterized protein n=1 Tax=Haloarcula nitratireducens TaxID=2487749 RepID=A0AAW4PDL7_9EURY|nr:hypothetical protein [Halomicroarcula nitratireducens]MBX0295678.1 hypothetical protein [Halomicroarcula nitratireducens]
MPGQVVGYQSDLLQGLIADAEREANLSSGEAETLRLHIDEATPEQEIATIWARLDEDFQILEEGPWSR